MLISWKRSLHKAAPTNFISVSSVRVCWCVCLNVCSNKLAGERRGSGCENAPFAYGYYVGPTSHTPWNDTVSLSRRVRPASAGTCFRFGFSHVPCKLPYATSATSQMASQKKMQWGMGMVSSWPEVVPPSANANDFSTHKPISLYEYLRLKCDPFTGSWNNPPPYKTFKGSSCNRRRTRHSPKDSEIIIIISLCQPSESNKHHEIVSQSCELFSKVEQNKEHDLWIYLKQCWV